MTTILIMVLVVVVMFAVERFWPANELPKVTNWWPRVILVNLAQAGIVLVLGATWDRWAAGISIPWALREHLSLGWQIAIGYVAITFIYYWWHRLRHESKLFWRLCHQLHHSPQRMEVAMSFYKHPVEITINGFLSSAITYLLLGCSPEAAALVTLATGIAEYFYHWDVKTPYALGWFFQRPESHRVHHQRAYHTNNYADIPLWDMLFGTYQNPKAQVAECGFESWREDRFDDMLVFRDVYAKGANETPPLHLLPTCIGCSKRWACQQSRQQAMETEISTTEEK
ncbi:MAG: sterol desaturase family protein [Verrucomicrobiota bacterium]